MTMDHMSRYGTHTHIIRTELKTELSNLLNKFFKYAFRELLIHLVEIHIIEISYRLTNDKQC